jgi:hypothetical protein
MNCYKTKFPSWNGREKAQRAQKQKFGPVRKQDFISPVGCRVS